MNLLEPLNGYVVMRPVEEEEQLYGNIVIPDLGKEKPEVGEVVAVSSTFNWHKGEWVPSQLAVGDKVLVPKLGSVRVSVGNQDYFITKEQDIYSKIS